MRDDIARKAGELEELLACYEIMAAEAARVKTLKERLRKDEMTVAVIGQFKRGKSSLINGILRQQVMPVGIVPVTAVVTKVLYGEPGAWVQFQNGQRREIPFAEMPLYVSEQENPENQREVDLVEIHLPAPFLKDGVILVDTPGVGSMHEKNTETAYHFVEESDAILFVLSVDSPLNQIEIDFLRKAREFTSKFYFAVNKADLAEEEDLNQYLSYCRDLLINEMGADRVVLLPVSGKTKWGLDTLEHIVKADLKAGREAILAESVRRKLLDVIRQAQGQIALYRIALSMPSGEMKERLEKLEEGCRQLIREGEDFLREEEDFAALEGKKNQIGRKLAEYVEELFGIEYYDPPVPEETADFMVQIRRMCEQMVDTLRQVLLYQEENAYIVVKRIHDLNQLARRLKKLEKEWEKEPEKESEKESETGKA